MTGLRIKYRYCFLILVLSALGYPDVVAGSEVTIRDTTVATNTRFDLPILTSDLTGLGAVSYDFTILYDDSFLKFEGFEKTNTISSGFPLISVNSDSNGVLFVGGAGILPLTGEGVLLILTFATKSDTGNTVVSFETFSFSDTVDNPKTNNGTVHITDVIVSVATDYLVEETFPLEFSSYPNPFNSSINIVYDLPVSGNVSIEIYDLNGNKVRTHVSSMREKGRHITRWSGISDSDLPVASGVYFCRISLGNRSRSLRLTYLK